MKLEINEACATEKQAVRAVAYYNGKVVLMYLRTSNTYVLPGGSIDSQESEKEALFREIREETGHSIINHQYCFSLKETIKKTVRLHHFYEVELGELNYDLSLTDEEKALGMEMKYYTPKDALNILQTNLGTHHLSDVVQTRELIGILHILNDGGQA